MEKEKKIKEFERQISESINYEPAVREYRGLNLIAFILLEIYKALPEPPPKDYAK